MLQSGDPLLTVYKTTDGRSLLGMLAFPAASAASMTCINTNPAGQSADVSICNSWLFTTRCTTVQSTVLLSHVVSPSVRLSVHPSVCLWCWWIMTT